MREPFETVIMTYLKLALHATHEWLTKRQTIDLLRLSIKLESSKALNSLENLSVHLRETTRLS